MLAFGIFCEWIYYKQKNDSEFAIKKWGWIYSIIINLFFVAAYISMLFSTEFKENWFIIIMTIYPLSFLIASSVALKATFKIEEDSNIETDPN